MLNDRTIDALVDIIREYYTEHPEEVRELLQFGVNPEQIGVSI